MDDLEAAIRANTINLTALDRRTEARLDSRAKENVDIQRQLRELETAVENISAIVLADFHAAVDAIKGSDPVENVMQDAAVSPLNGPRWITWMSGCDLHVSAGLATCPHCGDERPPQQGCEDYGQEAIDMQRQYDRWRP